MINEQIAEIFRDIARILEIKGENVFRVRAYERAAQNVEGLAEDLTLIAARGGLRRIPGIGADLSAVIEEYIRQGSVAVYEELKKSVPAGVLDLLQVSSIGPKTAKLLYEKLRIKSVDDLAVAIGKGRLEGLPGIKEKTIENLLKGIEVFRRGRERMTLGEAVETAGEFVSALTRVPAVKEISVGGSLRRRRETVRDIDILVRSTRPQEVMDAFVAIDGARDILAHGETKSSIRSFGGVQVDCRVVERRSYGAALVYFTGSKNFNIKIRQLAIKKGLKINEYGVFRGERFVAGRREKDVFRALGMSFIEPEMREDTGEIELALKDKLPVLVTAKDIRGDLHVHSRWSDGACTVLEMGLAAQKRGYAYIALTDHSQSLKIAGGVSVADLKKKKKEIDGANRKLKKTRILFGTEVDIDSGGNLDYPDKVLAGFDIVVAAIHGGFKQPKEKITARLVKACRHKHVHIIAHPTGRLWGVRPAYDFDFDKVARAAAETNTVLEINAYPQRLDLNDMHARRARACGARMAVSTDAHLAQQLDNMEFGLAVARRAWLGKADVVNCLPPDKLLKGLKQ